MLLHCKKQEKEINPENRDYKSAAQRAGDLLEVAQKTGAALWDSAPGIFS